MDYMHVKPSTPNLMKTTYIFGLSSIGCRRVIQYGNTEKNYCPKTIEKSCKVQRLKEIDFPSIFGTQNCDISWNLEACT